MPDLAKIKTSLQAKLSALTVRESGIDDELSKENDDDWQENAADSKDDEVLEEVGEMTQEEIHQIKKALAQIESGKHGICSTCGKPIASERLKALPDATECVKCS